MEIEPFKPNPPPPPSLKQNLQIFLYLLDYWATLKKHLTGTMRERCVLQGINPDCLIQNTNSNPLDQCTPHYFNIVENNYHQYNRTSLPSLVAELVYVLTHHTKPGRSQQNLSFVSSALTCGIPFQTVGHDLDLFLGVLHHWHLLDAQALSTFVQFQHPVLLIHLMWVCHVLLQKEIMQYKEIIVVVVVTHNML